MVSQIYYKTRLQKNVDRDLLQLEREVVPVIRGAWVERIKTENSAARRNAYFIMGIQQRQYIGRGG